MVTKSITNALAFTLALLLGFLLIFSFPFLYSMGGICGLSRQGLGVPCRIDVTKDVWLCAIGMEGHGSNLASTIT